MHVHDKTCDRIATISYRLNGKVHSWNVAASCSDNHETVTHHFNVHMANTDAELISITFSVR